MEMRRALLIILLLLPTLAIGQFGFSLLGKNAGSSSLYSTFNPGYKSSSILLSHLNLSMTSNNPGGVLGTKKVNLLSVHPLVYFECIVNTRTTFISIGLANHSWSTLTGYGGDSNSWVFYAGAGNGFKYHNGSTSALGVSYTSGDIISVAVDMTAKTVYFFKNGTMVTGGALFTAGDGIGGSLYIFCGSNGGAGDVITLNAGQSAFTYYGTITIGGLSLSTLGYYMGF